MTATLTGAIRAAVTAAVPAIVDVYRDVAPPVAAGATVGPYLVVTELVTAQTRPEGDTGDPTATIAVEEEVQVDLYQQRHNPTTLAPTADPALPDLVYRTLETMNLAAAPSHVYRFKVLTSSRTPDPDLNLDRVTYRCRASRNLA